MSKHQTVTITLELTEPQRIALEDMLATWNSLSNIGASRWTAFYADGDGDFHPKAVIDGHTPLKFGQLTKAEVWAGEEYRIDPDRVAWRLENAGK